ncbi:MAG: hypothetical protein E7544_09755 [Ruminococcaceae bacterium]|nr:hypothetical protein [Oscillospiraceae bacterium]
MTVLKNIKNVLYGLILIALGIVLGLNALGYTDINLFFDGWWTLLIIVPCVINLFRGYNAGGNLVGIAIGTLLLLICRDVVDPKTVWQLIIPATLVFLGAGLLFKDAFSGKASKRIKEINDRSVSQAGSYAAFSSQNINFSGQPFNGTDLIAAFGSITCDLLFAEIKEDCVINAKATFGGIDIIIPQNVNVVVKSTSLFGGVGRKRKYPPIQGAPTVYINAVCLFGGVDLK